MCGSIHHDDHYHVGSNCTRDGNAIGQLEMPTRTPRPTRPGLVVQRRPMATFPVVGRIATPIPARARLRKLSQPPGHRAAKNLLLADSTLQPQSVELAVNIEFAKSANGH